VKIDTFPLDYSIFLAILLTAIIKQHALEENCYLRAKNMEQPE
jgi:hypothetical protein